VLLAKNKWFCFTSRHRIPRILATCFYRTLQYTWQKANTSRCVITITYQH